MISHGCWLAIVLTAAATPRYPGATQVAEFDFRPAPQGDFNKPEGWVRYDGPGYPFYIQAELTSEVFAIGGRSLRIALNGGNCALFSPKVDANDKYNYVLRAQIKTEDLIADQAFIALEFLDADEKTVGSLVTTKRVLGTTDWQLVQIGPLSAPKGTRFLRVGCILKAGGVPDLKGRVYFDDIWIGQLPRFEITTSGPFRLFDIEQEKRVTIQVHGGEGRSLVAKFYLFDADRKPIADSTVSIDTIVPDPKADWILPMDAVGHYHLDIALEEAGRQILRRQYPVTVMKPFRDRVVGEFGLSLPPPTHGFEQFDRILAFSANRWVKIPFWPSQEHSTSYLDGRELSEFLDRIGRRGHLIVGRLDAPPRAILDQLAQNNVMIADVFSLPPTLWREALETMFVRYGLRISHWQLGSDDDRSFQKAMQFDSDLGRIDAESTRIGREIKLGVPWDYVVQPAVSSSVRFFALTDSQLDRGKVVTTPITAEQLQSQLVALGGTNAPSASEMPPTELWASIVPLSDEHYDRRTRMGDLARRVVAAKVAGAQGIFASHIDSPHVGLIDAEGAPTELFSTWRTLAEHLAGKQYLGSLPALGGAINHVFIGRGRATIVAWSDQPTAVDLVVGRDAAPIDLWGRPVDAKKENETINLSLDDLPTIITNADEFLIRFQIGLQFERGTISSRFGTHEDRLIVPNPSSDALSGSAIPQFPREWSQRPEQITLQILPKETARQVFLVTLPQGVAQQEYLIPIDFRIASEKSYRFRLLRSFRIGGDELMVEATPRMLPLGDLEIEAHVTNLTKNPMSLHASARVQDRRAEIDFLSSLTPGGSRTTRFLFNQGSQLRGKTVRLKFEDPLGRREFTFDVPIK
jgi:hypothetical protein